MTAAAYRRKQGLSSISNNGSSISVTMDTSTNAPTNGDLLVAALSNMKGSSVSINTRPSGWANLLAALASGSTSSAVQSIVDTLIAASTTGAQAWAYAPNCNLSGAVFELQNISTTNQLDQPEIQSTTKSIVGPTTITDGCELMLFASWRGGTFTSDPAGWTQLCNDPTTSGTNDVVNYVARLDQAAKGAVGTVAIAFSVDPSVIRMRIVAFRSTNAVSPTPADPVGITDSCTFKMTRALPALAAAFTDSFTRADNAALTGNWVNDLGTTGVVSNQAKASASTSVAYNTTFSAADMYAQATCVVVTTASIGVCVRWASGQNGYFARISSVNTLGIFKSVAGSATQLGTGVAYTPSANDVLKLEVVGSVLVAYVNGVPLYSVTDTTFTAAGNGGLRGSNTAIWDDFSAGPIGERVQISDVATVVKIITPALGSHPVGITDSASDVVTAKRFPADPVGLTDARVLKRTMGLPDPVGLLDSASQARSSARTQAEAVGITDSATGTRQLLVTINDSIGIADTGSPQFFTVTIFQTDAEGITDAVSVTRGSTSGIADLVGLLDAVTDVWTVRRTQADLIGLIDSAIGVLARGRVVPDTIGVTDVRQTALAARRAPADPVGLVDAASVRKTMARLQADPIGLLDTATSRRTKGQADPVGLLDAVAWRMSRFRTPADPIGIVDAQARSIAGNYAQNKNDSVGLADQMLTAWNRPRPLADPVGLTDQITLTRTIYIQIDDLVGVADLADRAATIYLNLGEFIGIRDDGRAQFRIGDLTLTARVLKSPWSAHVLNAPDRLR